jgi:Holliday junction resolvase RusA-like endonuclease
VRLVIEVHGIPAPQGSKRHVGGGVMVESSAKVKPWREAVRATTLDTLARSVEDNAGNLWTPGRLDPVELDAVFTLARPASHYRTGKRADQIKPTAPVDPVGRPDLDKLIRSTLDALTDAGALVDDARVVSVRAVKAYPGGHLDALDTPGAVITLWTG